MEASEFRDELPHFDGVKVLGVSPDPVASHVKFARKFELTYPILADPERQLIDKVGVWVEKMNYGKAYWGVERSTFLLDENGVVLKEWRKVKANGHAAEVVSELAKIG